ncbi:MAG: GNAT family N-acetyltransferase [Candidatus Binataceae bacterium]
MTEPIANGTEAGDLRLLQVDAATLWVVSPEGRIERTNDPDRSPGPRLFFAGCRSGNVMRVRHDLADQVASRLLAIGAEEPPWRDPDVLPQCVGRFIDVLSTLQPVATVAPHVIYRLPNQLKYDHTATIVRGDSSEGAAMLARFAERGLPQPMLAAGFKGVGDFWEPWCVVVERDEIAAIAFAARLGGIGAEIGVYTFPNFRARGFAAAVTASWSSMPSLDGRALFYSTARSNRSSQRVAARLGLRMIGASFSIG